MRLSRVRGLTAISSTLQSTPIPHDVGEVCDADVRPACVLHSDEGRAVIPRRRLFARSGFSTWTRNS
jgi:hypothetical protein